MKKFFVAAGRWAALIAAACALAALASCGGGSQDDLAASASPSPGPGAGVAQMQQAPQAMGMRLAAPAPLTPDQAMDWAEAHFSNLFPVAGKSAGQTGPYSYRYYPASGNYLGVSTGSADVAVYIFGPVTGGAAAPVRLAPLADYTCMTKRHNNGTNQKMAGILLYTHNFLCPNADNFVFS